MKRGHIFNRYLTFLFCLIIMISGIFIPVSIEAGESEADALMVGVPADRCPLFYQDAGTGEIVGIGVDLMTAVALEAGYTATFKAIEESTLKEALDNPEYDVIMPFGSAISSASGQSTIVTENLLQTPFTLVTEGGRELPPLNEIKVGMLRSLGGGAETVQQLYSGIEIVFYDTMDDSVKALRKGEVDALLHNSYVWSYVLQKPAYSDLSVQPSNMFSMDFRAGTVDTPEGQVVIDRLNQGIAGLSDTKRQAIILDYTSRRLYQYDFSDYFHEYWMFGLLVILLIAFFLVFTVQRRRTMRLEQEKKMRELIDHDPLTGVLSLNGFRKRVEELLRTHPDTPYLLIYNNIKNFKYINDSLGMAAGDELLRLFASRSMEVLSDEDAIGRIEADHFAVLRRAEGEERIRQDIANVCEPVRNFFINKGKENRVQICSGVYVLTPDDYQQTNVYHMLDLARVAEKRVRDIHNDGYEFYNPEQWEKGKRTAEVNSHLPTAIRNGEIQVWYQPQVNYDTGEIIGAEALCRWDHPSLGWLSPAEFIPTLEESGLIYELDCFVWDQVCQDLQRWNHQGIHWFVSVNLSRCDLWEDRNIPGHFFDLIQKYGLTTDQLRIEITETAYVEDPDLLIQNTLKLREFGFQVEMDDFGSGYSSLHMLKEVPVDRIKLDLLFLTRTGDPEKGRVIVSHMIQMVNDLGMELIAEGVENASQAKFLQSRGCSEMQGYYFYKPMSVQDFEKIGTVTGTTLP